MITNEEKENLINKIIKEKDVKMSKTFISKFEPDIPEDYSQLKAMLENNEVIKLDGLNVEGARIVKSKDQIRAENCIFTDFQFRSFECQDILFVNCRFIDFNIVGGSYPNITFIACEFARWSVKSSDITSLVDLSGMNMIRCKFDDSCRFTNTNLNNSNWLETDINDVDIVLDPHSSKKCSLLNYKGDDWRIKSNIKNDISNSIKNIDINTLEKEVIDNREYNNEEIDIKNIVNTDFMNCKFNNCIFTSDEFNEKGLLNYEIRTSFFKTQFYNCKFSCNLKSVLFEECVFNFCSFFGRFLYCIFSICHFSQSIVNDDTMLNYSKFIDCIYTEMDINQIIHDHGIDAILCEKVDKIDDINEKNVEIQKLTNEKNKAYEERDEYITKLYDLEEKSKSLNVIQNENTKLKEENETLLKEREMKELEINELNEKITLITNQNTDEIEKLKEEYEIKIANLNNANQTVAVSDTAAKDVIYQIIELIKNNTDVLESFMPKINNETVTAFLSKLDENQRFTIFSDAAMQRMKSFSKDGTCSMIDEDIE